VLDAPLERVGADPVMLDLLHWHGAEEVEHRSVAFDLFMHLDGRYTRRVRSMAAVTPVLAWVFFRGTRYLMHNDPTRPGRASLRGYRRAARRGLLPSGRQLVLPSGLVRQYSLCGDPSEKDHYRIAVRKIGAASAEVHALTPGTRVTVRGPRTAFPFVGDGPFLFVAGGIGITPILPMVRRAAAAQADWRLVYTGRSRASMPFLDELPDDDRVWIRPDTEYGVPTSGAELLDGLPDGASVYCCGPVPMITSVRVDLALTGAKAVHFERFAPPPIVDGEPFQLILRRSGQVLDVPAGRTALDVLLEARPGTPYSCRQGFCGTCAVPAAGGGSMRICVDRATTVLDL
jgi:ferredoxin-NADP reductase